MTDNQRAFRTFRFLRLQERDEEENCQHCHKYCACDCKFLQDTFFGPCFVLSGIRIHLLTTDYTDIVVLRLLHHNYDNSSYSYQEHQYHQDRSKPSVYVFGEYGSSQQIYEIHQNSPPF